jgi:hypothetical protein
MANLQKRLDAKDVTSGDMFGTRAYLRTTTSLAFGATKAGI